MEWRSEAASGLVSILTLGNVALGIILYCAVKVVYQIVHYRWFHPLSKFPGPFWGSVTRLWVAYHNVVDDEYVTEYELHKKYGPVLRITPTMLLISSAASLPEIYHRQANKSNHYITGSFGKTESLFNMQDWRQHAHFRKIAAGPYSASNIRRMEPLVDARITHWLGKLSEKFAGTEEPFDFAPWAVFMAYDVLSEIGFGEPFGFVESGGDVGGLIEGFHEGLPAFGVMARLYPFTYWVKSTFLGRYLVASPEQDSGIGTVMRFRDRLIAERLKEMEKGHAGGRVDLLQTFLDARDDNAKPLDMAYIKAEILLVLLAGADTTGTAFQALLYYVMSSPQAYETLMAELDNASSTGKLSSPTAQYQEVLDHCPYYIACVKESMRLQPSAPNIFPRLVKPGGMQVAGHFVPEGLEVTCNPWLVHRDEAIYGADANEFRPERWLEDEQRARLYQKYSMGFGYGARACLGQNIALMELYKAPLEFLRSFRLDVRERGRFVCKGGVGFYKDMWMSISKRPQVLSSERM